MTDKHDRLAVERVRHPIVIRRVHVKRVTRMSSQLVRITLEGAALQGFASASFDDHVKVFFPEPGQSQPVLPEATPNGLVFPEGLDRPATRDYTPRRFDPIKQELDIEFVLHGDGPACSWAAQASVGQTLGLGGPKGSFVIPTAFDWFAFFGDDTAIPAIARRLEELPTGKRVAAFIEVQDAQSQVALRSPAASSVQWLHRGDVSAARSTCLVDAARAFSVPPGEGYVWVAAESAASKAVREVFIAQHGLSKDRIRASSYWKAGARAVHESHAD